jgi:hypothetical protein
MHFGLGIEPTADALADTVEQQRVRYRGSPIVGGRGRSLHPGDALQLADTRVARALADSPDHRVVLLGDAAVAGLPDGVSLLAVTKNDRDALAKVSGLEGGGIVILRPDGYVGEIGSDADTAVAAYFGRLDG